MSDDLFIEEEESSGGGRANRPFAIIASVMALLLVIGIICVAVLFLNRGSDGILASLFGNGDGEGDVSVTQTVAARLTENADIATRNFQVTQTLIARATEDARPTETATPPPPTNTPVPTETPLPTNTPVVGGEDDGEGEATAEIPPSPTVGLFITQTPVTGGTGGTGSTGGTGTLPNTGLGMIGIFAAALGLLALGAVARRLRS